MNRNEYTNKTYNIVMTGLLMCMVTVATLFFKIPIMQGYVHLGNSMMVLAVMVLGKKNGSIAAGFGGALADLAGGFAVWAPWTFVISGGMALLVGFFAERNKSVIGYILGGLFLTAGYYVAEVILYGNAVAPIAMIPWNAGQYAIGAVLACVLVGALSKTPVQKYFALKHNMKH